MEYRGIIITGTSGAGKTTIARKLCGISKVFTIVQAVTTRKQRSDDKPGEYLYINEEEFGKLDKQGELLIESKYKGEYYGITTKAFQQVIDDNKVPLLILTPKSVKELESDQYHKGNEEHLPFLTVFLDVANDILDNRLVQRGEEINPTIKEQRREDRELRETCLYTIRNTDTDKTAELIWSLWEYRKTGGVLPKRLIQLMMECGLLLENARPENITGAAYDLFLGDEYYYGGKTETLTDKDSFITIDPYEYAIVTSQEKANLPKDIAGRFGLSVSLFCQGIILSNGPQVDPGFKGGLFCLLFNTSNDVVQLKRGQHYATIEFNKLIEPTVGYDGKYQDKDKIMEYLPKKVSRSPISELKKDIGDLKSEKWWIKILPLVISILAIILAIVFAIITSYSF